MFEEIYLDNAATTKPYPEVIEAMTMALEETWGNPSSSHARGKAARKLLEESRATVARALDVEPHELYFTSGGTEADNLAIQGACLARQNTHDSLITTTLEHPAVTKSVRGLRRAGWNVSYINYRRGALSLDRLEKALSATTALVTVTSIQNELGFCFPLREIGQLIAERAPGTLFHSDAVQAFGKLDFFPRKLGLDLASISAHKIGGPKGVGALYVKAGTKLYTTAFGGGQERGLRSGTEAVPNIVGFAKAVEIIMAQREQAALRARSLYEHLAERLQSRYDNVIINSSGAGSPYILSFSLPGVNNKQVLERLSEQGIFLSAASACASIHPHVPEEILQTKRPMALQLAGVSKSLLGSTFRVSFCGQNTTEEIDCLIEALPTSD